MFVGGQPVVGEPVYEAGDADKRKSQRCIFFRKAFSFLFSQVGLCAIVIVYAIVGGFVFQHLEKTNEIHECSEEALRYAIIEQEVLDHLWNSSHANEQRKNETTEDDDVDDVRTSTEYCNYTNGTGEDEERYGEETLESIRERCRVLRKFRKHLRVFRDRISVLYYNGVDCSKKAFDWTFAGSLLFSITVFTTIGYGNVAPRTYWGRLTCICYAMLGIPLMLICLSNLGYMLGDIFRYVYSRILCCGCCRQRNIRRRTSSRRGASMRRAAAASTSGAAPSTKGPILPSSRAAALINSDAATKIRNTEKVQFMPSGINDVEYNGVYRKNLDSGEGGNEVEEDSEEVESPVPEQRQKISSMGMMMLSSGSAAPEDGTGGNDTGAETTTGGDDYVTVPLTVSLGVIVAYLFAGSVLFGVWEGWDPLCAAYFCFVTISTIGFGDVVPGAANFQKDGDDWEMAVAAIFMLLGMALLSMCINLLQESMKEKCRYLGQKLGLID